MSADDGRRWALDGGIQRWALDGGIQVVPTAGSTEVTIQSPTALRPVEATPYQVQVLLAFGEGEDPLALLERYPFEREATRGFLERCRAAGILRDLGVHGRIEPPERVGVSPRFLGAPAFDPARPAAFTFLGVPFDGNTTGFPGARFGPAAIRAAAEGIRFTLDPRTSTPTGFYDYASGRELLRGVGFADAGDVHVSTGEDGPELYTRVTDVVRDLLEVGTLPLVVGGDHSLTAAVLAAFPPDPLQVVHLDAHTDLGEVERGDETGVHHGNVFTVALDALPHLVELRQIGLRGMIEAGAASTQPRARGVGMDALRSAGIEAALDGLDPTRATYVSVDIDVVDPSFAPSTGTPVPGGMFPHELKACLQMVGRRLNVVGADLMEVARPTRPADGTAGIAVDALLTLADACSARILAELSSSDDHPTEAVIHDRR